MAEQVTRSIRADAETFEKLKQICSEKGLKQGEAMEALLTAWEVQEAKGLVPERAADVADFDAHLQGIQKAFLRSLDLAQSAESRARISYAAQLDAMSGTIARLEKDLRDANAKVDAWTKRALDAESAVEHNLKRITELEQALGERKSTEAILTAVQALLEGQATQNTAKPKNAAKDKKSGKSAKTKADDFQKWNNEEIKREEITMSKDGNTVEFPEVKQA